MTLTLKSFVAFMVISAFASGVTAAPVTVHTRQISELITCNTARAKAVSGLQDTTKALKDIPTDSDPAIATAVSSAKENLQTAGSSIKTIAGALLTGQTAPSGERDVVLSSLAQAQTALQGISSTDDATNKAVTNTLSKLKKTIDAGNDAVNQCAGDSDSDNEDSGDGNSQDGNSQDGGSEDGNSDDGDSQQGGDSDNEDSQGANSDDEDTQDGNSGDGNSQDGGSDDEGPEDGDSEDDSSSSEDAPADTSDQDLSARQIGNVACNAARLRTATALTECAAAVYAIQTASKGDASTSAAAKTAQTALSSAGSGIAKIAAAIVNLKQAPAAARDQVATGMSDAQTAVGSITSTNKVVTLAVATAQKLIANAITSGNAVVAECK